MSVFEQQLDAMEQQLHDAVNLDDDHMLFIHSYLHGHFDLVVSRVLADAAQDIKMLDSQMHASLDAAFEQNELEPADQQLVWSLWQRLMQVAQQ